MKAKIAVHRRADVPKMRLDTCSRCGADRMINGRWLQVQRERTGLRIKDVAAALGMSRGHLSDIEHNRRNCKPRVRAYYEQLSKEPQ